MEATNAKIFKPVFANALYVLLVHFTLNSISLMTKSKPELTNSIVLYLIILPWTDGLITMLAYLKFSSDFRKGTEHILGKIGGFLKMSWKNNTVGVVQTNNNQS